MDRRHDQADILALMLQRASEGAPEVAYVEAVSGGLSRRAFLVLNGATALFAGAVVAGFKAISPNPPEASLSGSQLAAADQEGSVACPHGLINDPYPGRCHFYVDSDGDGICDYSVPGSGNNLASSDLGEAFGVDHTVGRALDTHRTAYEQS